MTQLETLERLRTGKAVAWRWTKDGMVPLATGEWTQATPAALEAEDLLAALKDLFEHCSMIHKHWGDNCNREQADAAQKRARAAIARAESRADA